MFRFAKNRWWTLILALSLCFACNASLPGSVRAEGPSEISDGVPGPQNGDPDLPTGPSKSGYGRGAMQPSDRWDPGRSAGDGRLTIRVVVMRLVIMVRGFRGFYLHF
jgi:hypothetical protein